MSTATASISGVVLPDGSLQVSGKLAVTPGPVRVTVEAVAQSPQLSHSELLSQLDAAVTRPGYQPRTREQVDADLSEMRDDSERELALRVARRQVPQA